jgi:hypothetical protein
MTNVTSFLIEPLSRPVPIYLFGDSHVLPLRDYLLRDTLTGVHFSTHSTYVPGVISANFVENGQLHPALTNALLTQSILSNSGRPLFLEVDQYAMANAFASGLSQSPPIILIRAGEIDSRSFIMQQLANRFDFLLPGYNSTLTPGAQIIPMAAIESHVKRILDPLFLGLEHLRRIGLSHLFLHDLPPPTLNQERFMHQNRYDCPTTTRYKVIKLLNATMAQRCKEIGVGFVDIWSDVTEDDQLRPEFEMDYCHLNRLAARFSLTRLLEQVRCNLESGRVANFARFGFALKDQEPGEIQNGDRPISAYIPPVALPFDPQIEQVEALPDDVSAAFYDWSGEPAVVTFHRWPLSETQIDALFRWVYCSRMTASIQRVLGGDFVIYSSRLISGKNADWEPCPILPPGLMRLLCPLALGDASPEILLDSGDASTAPIMWAPGGSLIYRPNEADVRFGDLGANSLILEAIIGPRHRRQPQFVLSNDHYRWPIDPFQASLAGIRSSPALGSELRVYAPDPRAPETSVTDLTP